MNSGVSVNQMQYGKYPLLFFIDALAGIFGTIFVSNALENYICVFLLYLGENTLLIMPFHTIIIGVLIKMWKILSKSDFCGFSLLQAILFAFAVLVLCYIPIRIVNTWFPILTGRHLRQEKNNE